MFSQNKQVKEEINLENIANFLKNHGNVNADYNEELKLFLFGRQLQVELPDYIVEKVQVQHLPKKQNAVLVEIEDGDIHQDDVVQTEKLELFESQKKIFQEENEILVANELEQPKDIPQFLSKTIPDNKSVFETILATPGAGDLIKYIWTRFELHSNEEILIHVSCRERVFKFLLKSALESFSKIPKKSFVSVARKISENFVKDSRPR